MDIFNYVFYNPYISKSILGSDIVIEVTQCEAIILHCFRFQHSCYHTSKELNIDKKTVLNFKNFIEPYVKAERFDIRNDYLVKALAVYIVALKSNRTPTKSTPNALCELKELYLTLKSSKDRSTTNVYNIINSSETYQNSELRKMGKSSVYKALKTIETELEMK